MVWQLQLVLLTAVAGTSTKSLGMGNGPGVCRPTVDPPGPQDTTALATVSDEPEEALIGSPISAEEEVSCMEQVCGVPVPPSGPRPFAARAKETESGRLARGAGESETARVAALVGWKVLKRRHGFLPCHFPGRGTRTPPGGLGSVGQSAASAQLVNEGEHTTRSQGIAAVAISFGSVGH